MDDQVDDDLVAMEVSQRLVGCHGVVCVVMTTSMIGGLTKTQINTHINRQKIKFYFVVGFFFSLQSFV